MDNPLFSEEHKAAFSIAIHDIEKFHDWNVNQLVLIPKSEYEQDHAILKAHSDGAIEVLDKIRAEIAEYGSVWVEYNITGRTDKDIEQLVNDVLRQAKEQVLDVIDKYRAESEEV